VDDSEILYEERGHVAIVMLNRPERLNALTEAMHVRLP
jgi:enoyl-CoA hydratase/carnithine racemase